MTASLPTGTVTFLFTDVEGSTKLWDLYPGEAGAAFARHDEIIEQAVASNSGNVVRPRGEGDSRFCVFARASDAVEAAAAIQLGLQRESWPFAGPLRVRISVHTGEADLRAGDYYGTAVNRCARLRGIAHGGQTLLTRATVETTGGALPADTTLRDLGDHVLRDLAHPERVFQLTHPDLPDDFPPLLSLDERRNNLPSELSSFVGREGEVKEVKQLVWSTRLLTLQGAAGCGKTRLALEVADEMIGSFADGVWFVDLAPIGEPSVIIESVASALGIHESIRSAASAEGHRGFRERLLQHLRDRVMLIVFDNCEHLVAAAADLIVDILRASPEVRVMVTSREALGVPSEVAWKVPSLSVPAEGEHPTFEDLSVYEGCKLFVERARERRPGIWIGEEDAHAIASICRRLDGIPLAIELAASRVRLLTPQQIDQRLSERFRLLVGGSRTALERQQTLRATVDWSYEPLGPQERAVFRRLGAFARGFTLEAVEAVCAGEPVDEVEVLDLLSSLVDKSLVESEEHGDDNRYRMLETFRQYAREKLLDAGETAVVRTRHRDFFLALAERAGAQMRREDQALWIARLSAELDNIRSALEWSAAEGGQECARIVNALWIFWEIRGLTNEGIRWADEALRSAAALTQEQRVDLLAMKTFFLFEVTDFDAARTTLEEWTAALEPLDDPRRDAWLALGRALVAIVEGDLARARVLLGEMYETGKRLNEPEVTWDSLWQLVTLDGLEGNTDSSRARVREMLALAKKMGDLASAAAATYHLGAEARSAGQLDVAENMFRECIEMSEQIDNRARVARSMIGLAGVQIDRGDAVAARQILVQGRPIYDGAAERAFWTLREAEIEEISGNGDAADALYRTMLSDPFPGANGSANDGLGRLAFARGDLDGALKHLRFALEVWARVGIRLNIPTTILFVAAVYARQGRSADAARLLGSLAALREQIDSAPGPVERTTVDAATTAVRASLGEESFLHEIAIGRDLGLQDAVVLAMGTPPAV